jgi:hypothetical protein
VWREEYSIPRETMIKYRPHHPQSYAFYRGGTWGGGCVQSIIGLSVNIAEPEPQNIDEANAVAAVSIAYLFSNNINNNLNNLTL